MPVTKRCAISKTVLILIADVKSVLAGGAQQTDGKTIKLKKGNRVAAPRTALCAFISVLKKRSGQALMYVIPHFNSSVMSGHLPF